MGQHSISLFDQSLPGHSDFAVHFNIGFKDLKSLSYQPLLGLLDSIAFSAPQYLFHTIHGPKEIHCRRPSLSHLLANPFNGFSKNPRMPGPGFFGREGDPHGSRDSDSRRAPDGHGSNGFCHRRSTPTIQIPNLLGEPPLIEHSYPVTLPFDGFEFHPRFIPLNL
jgi:hypothetical protein